jgi:hypothetical protein
MIQEEVLPTIEDSSAQYKRISTELECPGFLVYNTTVKKNYTNNYHKIKFRFFLKKNWGFFLG